MQQKAIIVGATSGIGEELFKQMNRAGYVLGITGRRIGKLEEMQAGASNSAAPVFPCEMDVRNYDQAASRLSDLILDMQGVDIIILNAGVAFQNPDFDPAIDANMIETNVNGFVNLANVALKYFEDQKAGQLVGISSIAALRGLAGMPAYHASKAFISVYMDGVRRAFQKKGLPVAITDIRPGYVETPLLIGGPEGKPWVAKADVAAAQILRAIQRKRRMVYVTKRWSIFAWMLRNFPDWLVDRLT